MIKRGKFKYLLRIHGIYWIQFGTGKIPGSYILKGKSLAKKIKNDNDNIYRYQEYFSRLDGSNKILMRKIRKDSK